MYKLIMVVTFVLAHNYILKLAGDRTFEPWTVTIINTTDFAVRDSMEAWMNGINGSGDFTIFANQGDIINFNSNLFNDNFIELIKIYT